ncbi:hypothetical protein BDN67DRAFT_748383 [Paxillus ammoniavirescens]|nr:hypothetical protein BDN67DRAFT_748383 [Paxillus ammoniavirescens]
MTTIGSKLAAVGKEEKRHSTCIVNLIHRQSPWRVKTVSCREVADFLQWLNGFPCTTKPEDTRTLHQAETCTWSPETQMYQSWRHGDRPFLWLQGKSGSGKSVLRY